MHETLKKQTVQLFRTHKKIKLILSRDVLYFTKKAANFKKSLLPWNWIRLVPTNDHNDTRFIYLNFVSSDNDIKQNNRNNGIADDTGNRRELVHLHGTYT